MARRPRDHRAEWARRKAKAEAEGYHSVYEKRTQTRINRDATNSNQTGFTNQIDRDATALAWSALHSRKSVTQFDPDWSEARKTEFYNTFIRIPNKGRRAKDIYKYLRRWEPDYADEHRGNYIAP